MESVASETVDSTLIVNGTSSSQEKAEISETVDSTLIVNGTSSSQEKAEISETVDSTLIVNGTSSSQEKAEISETVDSTLIVNGTSSSQEKAEISATYSWSHSPERDHAAATIQKYYKGFRARRILAVMSEAAAIRIQKHYRGFRTRRNLADSIIAAELLWQTTLSDTQKVGKLAITVNIESEKHIVSLLKWLDTRFNKYGKLSSDQLALLHCWETIDPRLRYSWNSHFFYLIWGDQCFLGSSKFDSYKIGDLKRRESLFTTGKPTSVQLRMNTASSTQHWISELTKAWKTWKGALQRWLEVIDPRHRVGRNLNFYFQMWMTSSGGQPFFYWLDVGDGKTVEHLECSREKLRHERNTYLELVSKSEAVQSLMSLVLRSESNTEKDINNNQREHDRAYGFNQQASNSEAVESHVSLMPRSERDTEEDINNDQREHDQADGFDRQASNSDVVEPPASLVPSKGQNHQTVLQIEGQNHQTVLQIDLKNYKRTHNGPADGFNQKDLLRRIFYAMNLLFEIATAVLDYLSSQQRQPRYALCGMILSITVMAISLIQLAYTGGKEEVSWQWKGWIPWFYHRAPPHKLFGNPVHILELLFSVSQCVFAIIAYHYLSRDQNNPTQFSIYPIAFAFCLLCLSFRRREP
ncbi:uncharacterized protein LOC18105927 isoform X7 [Populus trichocarpa]|uniref:uncharacterized protein LOC18105927 isoform X7 n=1 Tax=Populus trichocarpa TaxID=3694 RepID=UPI00227907B2|nr:uncharacterized protein LOC18105927 isoform X7 [Populus trichocarpa]